MRVFHIISGFENGGVEALLYALISHMPRDIEFHIVAHEVRVPECAARFEGLGVTVHIVPRRKKIIKHIRALRELFCRYRPDAVHVHTTEWGAIALAAAKKCGVSCRIQHTHAARREKNPLRRLWHQYLFWRARRIATDLFACGEAAAKLSFGTAALKEGRVTILKNGIDLAAFAFRGELRRTTRAALGVDEKTTLIGMVARFSPQKNHMAALSIFEAYRRVDPTAVLLLIGDGHLRPSIETLVRLMFPSGAVRFLGVRGDLPALYAAMDRFILPSRFEGLPLTLIEAQTAGLVCVVSDTITREVDFSGLVTFADNHDVAAWVAALRAADQGPRQSREAEAAACGYRLRDAAAALHSFYGSLK
ncbi:MAG: glycosyltransferase [Clostridia bacterium]|nr:glycosyltransferase [Clostridia bacterium]